mgnify:FL=1
MPPHEPMNLYYTAMLSRCQSYLRGLTRGDRCPDNNRSCPGSYSLKKGGAFRLPLVLTIPAFPLEPRYALAYAAQYHKGQEDQAAH